MLRDTAASCSTAESLEKNIHVVLESFFDGPGARWGPPEAEKGKPNLPSYLCSRREDLTQTPLKTGPWNPPGVQTH